VRGKTARLNAELSEQIAGLGVIQAYGREAAAAREFDRTNLAYCHATIRSIRYDAIQTPRWNQLRRSVWQRW